MLNKNLFSQCFIKKGTIKPISLGGESEISIRELNINEVSEFRKIISDESATQNDAMFYAVKCAMVEPEFFSDEQLKELNATGLALIQEVFNEIPLIGKTKKEREKYFKTIEDLAKKSQETTTENLEESEEKK